MIGCFLSTGCQQVFHRVIHKFSTAERNQFEKKVAFQEIHDMLDRNQGWHFEKSNKARHKIQIDLVRLRCQLSMRQVDAAGTSVPVCFDSISKFIY